MQHIARAVVTCDPELHSPSALNGLARQVEVRQSCRSAGAMTPWKRAIPRGEFSRCFARVSRLELLLLEKVI